MTTLPPFVVLSALLANSPNHAHALSVDSILPPNRNLFGAHKILVGLSHKQLKDRSQFVKPASTSTLLQGYSDTVLSAHVLDRVVGETQPGLTLVNVGLGCANPSPRSSPTSTNPCFALDPNCSELHYQKNTLYVYCLSVSLVLLWFSNREAFPITRSAAHPQHISLIA